MQIHFSSTFHALLFVNPPLAAPSEENPPKPNDYHYDRDPHSSTSPLPPSSILWQTLGTLSARADALAASAHLHGKGAPKTSRVWQEARGAAAPCFYFPVISFGGRASGDLNGISARPVYLFRRLPLTGAPARSFTTG